MASTVDKSSDSTDVTTDRVSSVQKTCSEKGDCTVATSSSNSRSTTISRSPNHLRIVDRKSLVEYNGPVTSFCGYCRGAKNERRSYDMQAYRLNPEDYQDFLDRGWRRSGDLCYHPENRTTCCPNFSIKCQAIKFQLTRSQRKCIQRLNNYLVTGSTRQSAYINYHNNKNNLFKAMEDSRGQKSQVSFETLKSSSKAKARRFVKACERRSKSQNISLDDAMKQVINKWNDRRPEPLSLEDYLFPNVGNVTLANNHSDVAHRLEINMYYVESNKCRDLRTAEHNLMAKYQKVIHKEARGTWSMTRYCDFLVESPIVVKSLENYDYLNHGAQDDPSCEILSKEVHAAGNFKLHRPPQLPTSFGTYHCIYQLDGNLIAVGVLDVLPKCITTVYFFYDPDYAFLNLGIYSALIEISMIRQMWSRYKPPVDKQVSGNILKYYNLGYYVPKCEKMHYKTRFKPSYLLCCKSYIYYPTQYCLDRLISGKSVDFCDQESPVGGRETIESEKIFEVSIEMPAVLKQYAIKHAKLITYLLWIESNLGSNYVDLVINGYFIPFFRFIGVNLMTKLCLKTDIVHRTLVERHQRLSQPSSAENSQGIDLSPSNSRQKT